RARGRAERWSAGRRRIRPGPHGRTAGNRGRAIRGGGLSLAGTRVVVSAGPTYEDLDPVRFLGNRSSGKMGFAIAAAAARRGADTVLVAGPVHLPTPEGVARIDVRGSAQMHAAVIDALPADVYIGAAAVADFTPERMATSKIKKAPGQDVLELRLV